VTATDISPAALEVARGNAQRHGVLDRIEFVQSDLLAAIPATSRFHFIVSNPPYVSESELESLAPEVRLHEPRVALVAGQRGTEAIQGLVEQAAEHLHPGGHLLMEISPMIREAVEALVAADPRYEPGPTVNDLARLPRVVQAKRK
jgi:release factor glutamine methyltransferase